MNSAQINDVILWGCAARELIMISLNNGKSTFCKKKNRVLFIVHSFEFIRARDLSSVVLYELISGFKMRLNLRFGQLCRFYLWVYVTLTGDRSVFK